MMLEAAKYIWISGERASDRNRTSEQATGIVRRVARSEQARIPTDALSILSIYLSSTIDRYLKLLVTNYSCI